MVDIAEEDVFHGTCWIRERCRFIVPKEERNRNDLTVGAVVRRGRQRPRPRQRSGPCEEGVNLNHHLPSCPLDHGTKLLGMFEIDDCTGYGVVRSMEYIEVIREAACDVPLCPTR